MRVTIRLFGRLHDLAGAASLEREVPEGATVADSWQALGAEFPAMAAYGRSVSAAVNEDFARMTHRLSDGDEVAFLPPVSGG
jgi:MoaE-MoaD fusion protein